MVLISLLGGLINLVSNYLFVHVGLQALLKLRTDLYSALQALPLKFHDARRSADSSFRVGQRQRIGIARAFLKNAPILLLNEPTSALDPSTESAIMGTIFELMRGRTTLIVTHRLTTVHGLGRIVVLKDGRLVEDGSGPELLAKNGVYAALYRDAMAHAG
jgi:ATP-binding cassette, subfamily B, bacterial